MTRREGVTTTRSIPPQVVRARLRVEALFRELEWKLEIGPATVTLASARRRTVVRFAAAEGGVFAQISIVPTRAIGSDELQELFKLGNTPAFKVGCIQNPAGTVAFHSESAFSEELSPREFAEWFWDFHAFVRPLFDDDDDQS